MAQSKRLPQQRIEKLSLPERIDVEIIEKMRPLLQKPIARKIGKLGDIGDEPPLLKAGTYHMSAGHSRNADLRSFPSGHTAGALAIARAFSRDYPRYTKLVLAAAAVVGALQVPRRAHYPGDVVAGGAAGAVAEKIASFIIDRLGLTNRRLRAVTPHIQNAGLVGLAGLEPAT